MTADRPRTRAIDGKTVNGKVEDLRILYGPSGEILKDYRKPQKEKSQ